MAPTKTSAATAHVTRTTAIWSLKLLPLPHISTPNGNTEDDDDGEAHGYEGNHHADLLKSVRVAVEELLPDREWSRGTCA